MKENTKIPLSDEILKIYYFFNNAIENQGIIINDTKELPLAYFSISGDFKEIPHLEFEILEKFPLFYEKYEQEKTHYNLIKSQLIHQLKMIEYSHTQDYTTRKWIYFNPIECISFIQYLVRVPNLFISLVWRSCDLSNLFIPDLINVLKITYKIFNEFQIKICEFSLFGLIGSLHKRLK